MVGLGGLLYHKSHPTSNIHVASLSSQAKCRTVSSCVYAMVSMAFPIHQRFPNKAKLASVSMEPSAMKNAKSWHCLKNCTQNVFWIAKYWKDNVEIKRKVSYSADMRVFGLSTIANVNSS